MKKRLIFFSLVFAVLAFASCKLEKGGTIEVTNGSNFEASIAVYKELVQVTAQEKAAPGKKITFSIDEDGTYNVDAIFINGNVLSHGREKAVLSGGNKESITVKPTN
ncbi:MAG: hypothetical protein LBC52_08120 [Treponema sp.]|jgi:molecular chaperone DnaK (HSP70)|nr:hypothetical protein [Treponema sp.]